MRQIRASIKQGSFGELRREWLERESGERGA
jgi:queuine/archaeosine tRNA-ribosyltransferase